MLIAERASFDQKSPSRGYRRSVGLLPVALFTFCSAITEPAIACMCSCEGYEADTKSDQYDQVFSGLILSAERVNEPVTALVEVGPNLVLDPGFWIKSKILVLRVWRGAPSTTAEVWTPVVTDCDTPPMPGLYFMALVRTKEGRSVAERAYCNCDEAALTAGGGTLVLTNVVILAAAIGVVGIALVLLLRQFRRSRR